MSRREARQALRLADLAPDGALTRDQLLSIALTNAVLALSEPPPPVEQPAAPADRVLYRDQDGDLWMCAPDGEPHVLEPERDRRKAGHVWHGAIPGVTDSLARVEREHGPLHVVPWPGEVR